MFSQTVVVSGPTKAKMSESNVQALMAAAERAIQTAGETDDKNRLLLGRLRRAIDMCEVESPITDVSKYRSALAQLEEKLRFNAAERAARAAQLQASNRIALLTPSGNSNNHAATSSQQSPPTSRVQLLSKSREANESLVRTRNIIVQQLSRVTEAGAVLNSDAEKLRDTGKEMHDYANSLHTSGSMIKMLQRRELTDRMLIYLGFGFLVLVAAFIVLKRVWRVITPLVWLVDKVWGIATTTAAAVEVKEL